MAFCRKCGAELREGLRFCSACGSSVQEGSMPSNKTSFTTSSPIASQRTTQQTRPAANCKSCPFCGEEILAVAIKCKHCGEDLNSQKKLAIKKSEGIGIVNIIIPLCSAFLAWFWIANTSDVILKIQGLAAITILVTSILMAVEAYNADAGNENDLKPNGKKREGPILWFLSGILLWIFAYPMWMARRTKYGFRNLCGAAVFTALVFVGVITGVALTGNLTDNLQSQVQDHIQQTFAKEQMFPGARINSFSLIHKEGNQYEGLLEMTKDGDTIKLTVDVTYDGKQFMWKIRPY